MVLARESLPRSYAPLARYRRNRVLAGAAGLTAVNDLAARLALRVRPNLPYRISPQRGIITRKPIEIVWIAREANRVGLMKMTRAWVVNAISHVVHAEA